MINYSTKLFCYKDIFNHFISLDQKKKLPSRILFTGQEGIGKTTLSFHLINYLLSKNEANKYNIDKNIINRESKSYNFVNNLTHPNFYLISKSDSKKNIEIEQIRNLINFINKSSFDNQRKIILIDGVENLNPNSSNALLKSLEEANKNNMFILTHNINKSLLDTIKSRCLTYKLNFNYSEIEKIIFEYFGSNLYENLNIDFKSIVISPKFLIDHINFALDKNLILQSLDIEKMIQYVINNKSYKKNDFINNNFQNYIEIYFKKMYLKTKDNKYYNNYLKTVSENNLFNKFNLDLDSFFIQFENKYLNN